MMSRAFNPKQVLATGRWPIALAGLLAVCVLSPVFSLVRSAIAGQFVQWEHLIRYVIPEAALTTLLLLSGVAIVVTLLGTGAAWLVTAFQFPGRRIFSWALLLPLAVPTYVVAYAYLDLLHPIGPIQNWVRAVLGYQSAREFRLPDIRSMGGAIFVLGSVLYPYVYLSARYMFLTQPANLLEAGRSLGEGSLAVFFRLALPLARPGIVIGITLALLETLKDIGASEFLGLQTITVTIYTTWLTRSDLAGAAHIALVMLCIVFGFIALERYARRQQRFSNTDQSRAMNAVRLTGWQSGIACLLCCVPIASGFLLPTLHLCWQAYVRIDQTHAISSALQEAVLHTTIIGVAVTCCTVAAGLLLAWVARSWSNRQTTSLGQALSQTATIGYALPGTVLALGLLAPYAWLDEQLNGTAQWLVNSKPQLWLLGSMTGLVLACSLRFIAISCGAIKSGFERIPLSFDQSARVLGQSPVGTLLRIDLPLLRPALLSAALLVFVETIKELPVTLLLRPLKIETLATWLYGEAARGTYEEGAIAALLIIVVSLLPVIFLTRTDSSASSLKS